MSNDVVRYTGDLPPTIISHGVWLSYRFTMSVRDVEGLLAHRDITVSYERIVRRCENSGLA
jgi:transposase-like protein